ncbi:MAG TPA: hypothetical protein PK954_18175 [Anaerolineales bacterium]|nr:hypothetical protein [Anaerolineales bacterium]
MTTRHGWLSVGGLLVALVGVFLATEPAQAQTGPGVFEPETCVFDLPAGTYDGQDTPIDGAYRVDCGWLTVPAELRILFELPYEERLASALELLGVNLTNLADEAGHA